jgi:hypothetical protein
MTISPGLSQRIEREISMLKPEPIGHINYEGVLYRGLPVLGTIGEVWLLRADGSLWRVDSDLGLPLEPLPERLRTMALVAGTERYPWLHEMLPSRPPDAVDCSVCQGQGRIRSSSASEAGLFCDSCDALGWLSASR